MAPISRKLDLDALKKLAGRVAGQWGQHNVPRLAAAFSFYAILSLVPTLLVVLNIAVMVWGNAESLRLLETRISEGVGPGSARYIVDMIQGLSEQKATGALASIVAIAVTFFSASNLFLQLEDSMATIWGVPPEKSFVKSLILTRLKAFAGVVLFAALLLGWMALDSWLGWLARHSGLNIGWRSLSFVVSILFLTGVFGVFLKAFPRNQAAWRDVWIGAGITGLVLTIFKLLVSQYVVGVSTVNAYGAAGSLVVILLWLYYTAMMFFVGAEITFAFAHEHGSRAKASHD